MSDEEPSSPNCYFSPKLELRKVQGKGSGIFARQPVRAGEVLLVMGGDIINPQQLAQLHHTYSIQVEEDLYLAPIGDQPAYKINHSCNPNVGVLGQITFVAMRDIAADEELCYDYAMTDGTPYDEFDCHCGAPDCRGRITGDDWRSPALWERYKGYVSPYLQRRIERLQPERVNGQKAGVP